MKKIFLNKRIKMKKGSGEILGFAIVLPFLILLIVAILSAAQLSVAQQKLCYACYTSARAACVSDNADSAKVRVDAVLSSIYGGNYQGYRYTVGSDPGNTPSLGNNQTYASIQLLASPWKKGTMVRVTVYQKITPLMPFSSSVHSQSITAMIENDTSASWNNGNAD